MELTKMKIENMKAFTVIPNVAFGFNTEYHLSQDELYVYAHLQFLKQYGYTDKTVTMVDMLVEVLGWQEVKPFRPKARVAKALEALQDKGYIGIDCTGDIKKAVLHITINKDQEQAEAETEVEWKDKPYSWKGFTVVSAEQFNLIESAEEFMVLAYTTWRANADFDYKICFKEWAGVLGVAERTARLIIPRCESFLVKTSGKTIVSEGQVRQEPNSYKIATPEKEVKAEEVTVPEVKAVPVAAVQEEVPYSGFDEYSNNLTAFDQLLEELGKEAS